MIAFAELQFWLARRRTDGATERDHLESVERQTGFRPPALDGPELPADGAHVWSWFLTLHQTRGSNGFGGNPISFLDIAAWVSLTGVIVRPSEIEAIMAIDRVWLAHQAQTAATKPAPAAPDARPSRGAR